MDQGEIERLVGEVRSCGTDTPSIEVKAAVGRLPKTVPETLSAFSNGSGGTLILGLDEATGFRPAQGFDPVRTRDALARACADDVQPPIRIGIEIVSFEDAYLVVAQIPEIDPLSKPSYIKSRGEYQGSFIRSGDGDRKLTEYEVGLLRANRGQPRYDRDPMDDASMADLDEDAVVALLRRVRQRQPRAFRSVSEEVALQRLGVLVPAPKGPGSLVPSLAGLLTLGTYPQQFFPQLNATFAVLPSETMGAAPAGGPRFIDNRSFNGAIPWMVVDAVDAIARNMRVEANIRGVGREDVYEYPVEALREAMVNALMHRDYGPLARGTQVQVEMYPDRLLIRNPGGLFGPVTEGELGTEGISSSRNSVLSSLLQEVQLPDSDHVVCENRGTGIPTMLEQLRRSGTASVRFSNAISHFTVTFSRARRNAAGEAPSRDDAVAGRSADILSLFMDQPELSAADIIQATGLSRATVLRYLAQLVEDKLLEATAPPSSHHRTYRRPTGAT
jgi:ATP-dependent DNA helicase RecG